MKSTTEFLGTIDARAKIVSAGQDVMFIKGFTAAGLNEVALLQKSGRFHVD